MSGLKDILRSVPGVGSLAARLRRLRGDWQRRVGMRSHVRRMRKLRGIHRGRRGWIIGNGPSLTELDLSLLDGEITFGCNGIWMLYDELNWRPTYYCVEDVLVAEDDADTINALGGSTKIFPYDLRHVLRADAETIYVNLIRGEGPGFPRFSERCDQVLYWGGTVAYMMLQLARWVGCDPIYLIGMDMGYRIHGEVDGTVITSREADMNHFHPDYFGAGKRWHVPRVERMQRCLSAALGVLTGRSVRVWNATRGGKLRDFPRVTYEDVFAAQPAGQAGPGA